MDKSQDAAHGGAAVIVGATSALGQAVARQLADRGQALILVARDAAKLAVVEADLTARGVQASSVVADLDDTARHADLIGSWTSATDFYLFYGTLPDQKASEADWAVAAQALHTNFLSAASLLTRIANLCESRRSGSIVVVTSVAGDRGRQSNYVYGTAKGALSIFCQGLRNRLSKVNVPVTTIKPGFIDTPMTADVPKKPAVLWATPEKVAADIVKAHAKGSDIVYSPWFWRFILLIVCAVPERIFKKMSM